MRFCFLPRPISLFLSGSALLAGLCAHEESRSSQAAKFLRPISREEQIRHASSRLTFGPRPGELEVLRKVGPRKWAIQQIDPKQTAEDRALEARLEPFESLRLSARESYLRYPPPQLIAQIARGEKSPEGDPELRAAVAKLAESYREKSGSAADGGGPRTTPLDSPSLEKVALLEDGTPEQKGSFLQAMPAGKRLAFALSLGPERVRKLLPFAPVDLQRQMMRSVNPQRVIAEDLAAGKLLRAVYSHHQLEELLVDFWFNHFNVFHEKGADRYLAPSYERDVIRPHVFGKFHDLLLATAESPAMLFYLDNWQSVSPSLPSRQGKKRGLNENYGRELLELHTLGVDGGYRQKDVTEVARCFTGWTIRPPAKGGTFEFNPRMHDEGKKIVLGHVIEAGGMQDGSEVLRLLARSPNAAHHICLQLAQRFVADDPPKPLVDRMRERQYLKHDGDLREVMRTLLESPEFWSQGAYRAKVKTPLRIIASALRRANAEIDSAFVLSNELQKLGQPLYRKLEPTGYSFASVIG